MNSLTIDRRQPSLSCQKLTALVCVFLFAGGMSLYAQPDRMLDTLTKNVVVEQKLGSQIDLSLQFTDDQGKKVRLSEYFGQERPVVLNLVYYGCPMLCGQILNGTVKGLKETDLEIGEDYDIVSISFDHTETIDVAAKKKRTFVRLFNRDATEKSWQFLTSDSATVATLAEQVGFKYFRDEETGQYAHSSAIMLLTPEGKISRYFFGIEYDPQDLQLGLVEASDNKVGSLADQVLLLCFQYNPETGTYGFAITTTLKITGTLTLLILVAFIVRSIRRDKSVKGVEQQHNPEVGLQGRV